MDRTRVSSSAPEIQNYSQDDLAALVYCSPLLPCVHQPEEMVSGSGPRCDASASGPLPLYSA